MLRLMRRSNTCLRSGDTMMPRRGCRHRGTGVTMRQMTVRRMNGTVAARSEGHIGKNSHKNQQK
ncbi:MAG: hypothetical protein LBQ20_09940 [Rhodanobacter sp.]|jgi:hypothetical protein|nr:hypothetical protein [Rhodanobacter sp.]